VTAVSDSVSDPVTDSVSDPVTGQDAADIDPSPVVVPFVVPTPAGGPVAGGPAGTVAGRPDWLGPLAEAFRTLTPLRPRDRVLPPAGSGRPAAVLILLADGPSGPDVLLIERAAALRSHAGQPAFPGGATDPGERSPVETALREATEEVGLDPSSVDVLAIAPVLYLPPSNFLVTPVLGWWRTPGPVAPVDPAETSAVVRVPIRELAEPANRVAYVAPRSGWLGPAFDVRSLLVWGFTAGLLDALLRAGGWERPWEPPARTIRPPLAPDPNVSAAEEAGEIL
jgi:8-oxo-dGTP pyrophosphatase MutT (NUDIX family)